MINAFKAASGLLLAASAIGAQQGPAVRALGPMAAVSTETFGPQVFVRHVRGGVLVNDIANRRLLMFDSTMSKATVVADTTPATASAYSGRTASLIAYRGDSTLFVDASSLSMLVIDPLGRVGRVMSVPRSQDAMVLGNSAFGTPAFDGTGRLVYRGFPRPNFGRGAGGPGGPGGGGPGSPGFQMPEPPDSTALTRVDLATRVSDTIAYLKIPKVKIDVQRDDNGNIRMNMQMNPLPVIDDWAVTSDGSIALIRGRDYHVDWIRKDGTRESSPKMPFDWQRLTDEDKVAFIDSLKAARARMAASGAAGTAAGGGIVVGGGGGEQRITIGGELRGDGPRGDGPRGDGPRGGGPGGGGPGGGGPRGEMTFVSPSDLPDYKPPFFAGAVRADEDGHLWVRTIPTKGIVGGPVYDVIDTKGALVDRVQVPKDRVVVGFGTGGVVYLLATDGTTRKLERARFK